MSASRAKTWIKPAVLLAFLATLFGFLFATEAGRAIAKDPAAAANRVIAAVQGYDPVTQRLLYVGLYVVGTVLLLPGTFMSFAGAVLFGPYEGTLYTWIGGTVGATLAYLNARRLGRESVERLFGGRFAAFDRRIGEHGFTGLLVVRLLPIFPFSAVNFGCGFTSIRLRDYVLATAIGIVPGTFVYQLLFAKFKEKVLDEGLSWEYFRDPELWGVLGLFLVFLVVGKWLAGKVARKKPPEEGQA